MSFETIELSRQLPIALLGLNRPDKLNAIMIKKIKRVFEFKDSFAEIDINSVLVNDDEALAVDALIIRRKSRSPC